MEVSFGKWVMNAAQKQAVGSPDFDVKWKEDEVINGHMLIAGGSGTGKTHNIRSIIRQAVDSRAMGAYYSPLRIHVIDVHDDIHVEGASEVLFSESTRVGLNPLVVDPDPHTGGVRKAIQHFISTLNKTSRQLGDRQESVLRAILEDLYAANGFYADDPKSWTLTDYTGKRRFAKKFPNIEDLHRWTSFKYKQMFMGGNTRSAKTLDSLNKETSKMMRLMKEASDIENDEQINKLKDAAIESYTTYITEMQTGKELEEYIKFDSKTTLKSVLDRISNLKNCGIFRNETPNFDTDNPVWRYRLKALGTEEKKMFVHFKLKELYDDALRRGEQDNIVEMIFIDEANMFMDSDPDNIISIMANQIRKFGTALICASQSFTHFSDDFLASVATKIVLGVDELYFARTAKQLNIKSDWLAWITPRRTALIQIKRNAPPNDPSATTKWFFVAFNK